MGKACCATLAVVLAGISFVHGSEPERRQAVTTKYCNAEFGNVCYAQYSAANNVVYRVAIPDTASAPFDALIQIVSPASLGWAGIAWGGSMANNPLTVAWGNGDGAVVSSRWTTGHTVPQPYAGATYTALSSWRNASHWSISALCDGCSAWSSTSLDPGALNTLAWASGNNPPAQPANNASVFGFHNAKGRFTLDLSVGRVPSAVFRRYLLFLQGQGAGEVPGPEEAGDGQEDDEPSPPPTARPTVRTSVTILTPATTLRPQTPLTSIRGKDSVTFGATTLGPARPTYTPNHGDEDEPLRFTTKTVIVTVAPPAPTQGPDWDDEGDGGDGGDDWNGETGSGVTITMGPGGGWGGGPPWAKGRGGGWRGRGRGGRGGGGGWRGRGKGRRGG